MASQMSSSGNGASHLHKPTWKHHLIGTAAGTSDSDSDADPGLIHSKIAGSHQSSTNTE
jgi:hypothetical protein